MPIQFSPDDFQNNDFQLAQDNAGDLVLEHKQTGGRFKFDATTDSWVPVQGLDLQGADIVNVGASKTNFTEKADLTDLQDKADLTSSNGVLQSSQLPDLAITNIDVVANQSERLSLTAEEGDVAVQTDVSQTFILSTNDPTVDSNWKQIQLDVLGAIDGQTITPAQTGTSTNPTTVESDTVTATNIEAGQIGDSSNRPDLFADEINVNQIETPITTGSFSVFQFADAGGSSAVQGVRATDNVSTTNKEIYDAADGGVGQQRSVLLHVHGRNKSVGGRHFTDIVVFVPFGEVTVIGSASRPNTASRTYTENKSSLELSMSQNTFDVIVSVDALNTG